MRNSLIPRGGAEQDPNWEPPFGDALDTSLWEEILGKTQNLLEGQYTLSDLETLCFPPFMTLNSSYRHPIIAKYIKYFILFPNIGAQQFLLVGVAFINS